jgi:hypothetical protein
MVKIKHCTFQYFTLPVLGIRFSKWLTHRTIGICLGPIILVREDYWNDNSTWLHELEHVKQTVLKGFVFHFVLYYFSSTYRCACEVQAYTSELVAIENVHDREAKLEQFTSILADSYRLPQSRMQITQLLKTSLKDRLLKKQTLQFANNF